MANSKGSSNIRNLMYAGKQCFLPPKSPFTSISSPYADYVSNTGVGLKSTPKPREGNVHHQRTSSESLLMEEQPSWLDDLLNEPETPVRKGGHRRSSSDSFAYVDVINTSNGDYIAQDEYKYKNVVSVPSWGSQEFDHFIDGRQASLYSEPHHSGKSKNRASDSSFSVNYSTGLVSVRDDNVLHSLGSSPVRQEADGVTTAEKQDQTESGTQDLNSSSEKKDSSAKHSASETETKRAKQQFAQRSRVRKLQYIAELERNAEGSEVSAELEFLNQQNLILSMENKALKQRLDNLAQEQLIKYLEHEMLEREIGRLRALYQQQQQQPQQQPQPSSGHRRTKSRDLESQFANLNLKQEANSSRDPATTFRSPSHLNS
ncbi:hypothetical protein RJ641_013183 [Dillenia turbinata]|uniref:BZIP domain-containing protein n=1 Tax=Dillenia turbinata TaxID=194707 RepID=A0AAN8W3T2_9MAGN